MTGIFDSGVGGLTALRELRRLKPNEDICYLADKKNAPYGNKDRERLTELVMADIDRLRLYGCEEILIACCTASTVYGLLPEEYRQGVLPIITPAAELAVSLSGGGRIAVIATDATVRSRAFEEEIYRLDGGAQVLSVAAQPLVGMVEQGERDGSCSQECRGYLRELLEPIFLWGAELIILGCTHFTHLRATVEELLGIRAVSPSLVGAAVMAGRLGESGEGRTVYL